MLRSHLTSWCYSDLGTGFWMPETGNIRMLKDAIDRGAIDDLSEDFDEWWTQTKELIWNYSYEQTTVNNIPNENEEYLLHAALMDPEIPPQIVHLLLKLQPDSVYLAAPGGDMLPIHIAASTNYDSDLAPHEFNPFPSSSILQLVVKAGAKCVVMKAGEFLPLHLALQCGKTRSQIKVLVHANEKTVNVPHPVTGLFPFQLAAQENECSETEGKVSNEIDALDTIFHLLGRNPLLVDHANWTATNPEDVLLDEMEDDSLMVVDGPSIFTPAGTQQEASTLRNSGSLFGRRRIPAVVFSSESRLEESLVSLDTSSLDVCGVSAPARIARFSFNSFHSTPEKQQTRLVTEETSIFADAHSTAGDSGRKNRFSFGFRNVDYDEVSDTRNWREPDSAPIDFETKALAEPKRKPNPISPSSRNLHDINFFDEDMESTQHTSMFQRVVGIKKHEKKTKSYSTNSNLSTELVNAALDETNHTRTEAHQVVSEEEWDAFRATMRANGSVTVMKLKQNLSTVLRNRPSTSSTASMNSSMNSMNSDSFRVFEEEEPLEDAAGTTMHFPIVEKSVVPDFLTEALAIYNSIELNDHELTNEEALLSTSNNSQSSLALQMSEDDETVVSSVSNEDDSNHENDSLSTPNKKRLTTDSRFQSPTSVEALNDDLDEFLWPTEIYWPHAEPVESLSQLGIFMQEATEVVDSILHPPNL